MPGERLHIEFDDDDGWVKLRKECGGRTVDEDGLSLPRGFTPDDLREALLATGWVRGRDEDLQVADTINCRTLCEFVSEMFLYFDDCGIPGEQLLQIKGVIDQDFLPPPEGGAISLWSYAWLDLMVREDIADEARGCEDPWTREAVIVDARSLIRRRIDELLQRAAISGDAAAPSRMAPSQPRRSAPSRIAKSG